MNDKWKMVKLRNVSEQIRGVSYKPSDVLDAESDESATLLRANNISDDLINYDDLVFVKEKKVSEEQYLKKGDILICASSGSKHLVGKAACFTDNKKVTFGAFCKVVRPNNINYEYLKHYFFSPTYRQLISNASEGANINNIKTEDISNLEIPLPPLETQKQIAANLDQVTKVIAEHKELLAKYDLLVKSRFIEMFGDPVTNPMCWEVGKMSDITTKITDGEHGTVPRCDNNGFLYLMARNVTQQNTLDLSEISYIPEENHKKIYKRCNPEEGDLLLVCVGATVGKSCLVPSMSEFSMARSLALLKPDYTKINSQFLLGLVSNFYIQNQIQNCVHAAAQAGLYTNMISNLNVYIPPLELQNKFAAFVQQIDSSKAVVQQSLQKAETLYKSLMQEYFG